MAKPQILPSEVSELIRIARQYGLSEVSVQQGEARVFLRLTADAETISPAVLSSPSVSVPVERPANVIQITSPMAGVFYISPSPGEPPFVSAGDIVREGDPIGLIEAMKVFSEVLSDHTGRVKGVLVPNGQLVQQGDLLVELTALEPGE